MFKFLHMNGISSISGQKSIVKCLEVTEFTSSQDVSLQSCFQHDLGPTELYLPHGRDPSFIVDVSHDLRL